MNTTRLALDVSRLPASAIDHRSPIWWGNLLLLFIETTMFALLLAGYFFVRQNFDQWPPPRADGYLLVQNPVPLLGIATVNMVLLMISLIPAIWMDRACLRKHTGAVKVALLMVIAFGVIAIVLRFYEFPALQFKWNENAYGSIVWTLLGLHTLHLMTDAYDTAVLAVLLVTGPLEGKRFGDVAENALYWNFVVIAWVPIYAIIYIAPRVI